MAYLKEESQNRIKRKEGSNERTRIDRFLDFCTTCNLASWISLEGLELSFRREHFREHTRGMNDWQLLGQAEKELRCIACRYVNYARQCAFPQSVKGQEGYQAALLYFLA